MKKEKIKIFIGIFVTLLISYIAGFIFSNYNLIKNGSVEIKTIEVISTNLEKNGSNYKSVEDKSEITFNLNKKFINKIFFKYKTNSNFSWVLKYNETDYYGNYVEKTLTGVSSNKINVFSEKINNKLDTLTLFINNKDVEINNIKILNEIEYVNNTIITFILAGITVYLIIKFKNYFSKRIEYMFLVIAITSGIAMIISIPLSIGISWDEQIHFDNIYSLSNEYYSEAALELIHPTETNFSMFNTSEEEISYIKHLNEIDKKLTNKSTNVRLTYNMISYIPEILIFNLGKKIGLNISTIFILGKICNLILYSIIIFFAIKKIPKGKYLMSIIALFPTCIFLASNYSYDPFITAFIFLGFANFYYELISKDKKINPLNIVIAFISFIIASLPKAIYIPFILLLLLIPKEKFKAKSQRIKFKISIILVFTLIMSTFVLPTISGNALGDNRGGDTSVSKQLNLIINQPISFFKVFKENAVDSGLERIIGTGGITSYSYKGNISDKNIHYLFLFLLLFSINVENRKENKVKEFDFKEKIFISILSVVIICFIWGAMYLSFTPVGLTTINGVQNRYFIPLLLPILLLFNNKKITKELNYKKIYILIALILVILSYKPILIELT